MSAPSPLRRVLATLLLVATAATGACVGQRPSLADKPAATVTTAESTTTTAAPAPARVAQAKNPAIDVFDDATTPTPRGQVTAEEATSAPDIPLVFLVKGEDGERLEVYLPTPSGGATGWVRQEDVVLSSVTFRIEVDLTQRRVRVYDGSTKVLDARATIGPTDRPPAGVTYYLKELLQAPDPNGPYGTYAYGLSGFSTTLASFTSGTGVVGIHGTSDAESIGKDAERGSIGLSNADMAKMVNEIGLPLGTPVEIFD